MYSRESIKAFVEEYVYTIKEFIDTSVNQLSIPHHFVNSSFPSYMTAKGIYSKIYVSKEGLAIIFDLKNRSKLESHIEYISSPVTRLFSKKTENVIPFFQVDESFCRAERIIFVTKETFNNYYQFLKNISYCTIFTSTRINTLTSLGRDSDVKFVDVSIDANLLPGENKVSPIARVPFLWFISYPPSKLKTNVARYHAFYETSTYLHRLFARPAPRVLDAILYKFEEIIKNEKYEKPLHEFLCKYPWFIRPGIIYSVCNEQIGKYKPDLVAFLWDGDIVLIELESARVKLFTKQGTISSEFEKRLKQIRDYVAYYREHKEVFNKFVSRGVLREIPKGSQIKGTLIISSFSDLDSVAREELDKIRSIYEKEGIEISTYDELIIKISFMLKYISGEMFRVFKYILMTSDVFKIEKPVFLRSFVSLIGCSMI